MAGDWQLFQHVCFTASYLAMCRLCKIIPVMFELSLVQKLAPHNFEGCHIFVTFAWVCQSVCDTHLCLSIHTNTSTCSHKNQQCRQFLKLTELWCVLALLTLDDWHWVYANGTECLREWVSFSLSVYGV